MAPWDSLPCTCSHALADDHPPRDQLRGHGSDLRPGGHSWTALSNSLVLGNRRRWRAELDDEERLALGALVRVEGMSDTHTPRSTTRCPRPGVAVVGNYSRLPALCPCHLPVLVTSTSPPPLSGTRSGPRLRWDAARVHPAGAVVRREESDVVPPPTRRRHREEAKGRTEP